MIITSGPYLLASQRSEDDEDRPGLPGDPRRSSGDSSEVAGQFPKGCLEQGGQVGRAPGII